MHLTSVQVHAPLAFVGNVEIHNLFARTSAGAPTATRRRPATSRLAGHALGRRRREVVLPTPDQLTLDRVGFGLRRRRVQLREGRARRGPAPGESIGAGIRVQKIAISFCAGPPLKVEGRIGLTALPDEGKPQLACPTPADQFDRRRSVDAAAEAPAVPP